MATMVSGLGGPAGYGENVFSTSTLSAGNLDDGSIQVDITSVFGAGGIDFFGTNYTSIYINSNGNISFGQANANGYHTNDLSGETIPSIAPFWADVNLNNGGEIYWDLDPANGTVTITWDGVAPYSGTGANSFQVVLTDLGNGNFSTEFIYEDIQWTDGGGNTAQTGITDGGTNDYELDGSGNAAALANYENTDFSTGGDTGTTTFALIDGSITTPDGVTSGTSGADTIDNIFVDADGDSPGAGDDYISGLGGNDTINAYDGDDSIFGGAGADTIDGGAGADTIYGDNGDLRENQTLVWRDAGVDGDSLAAGMTQDTGGMEVSVSFTDTGNNAPTYQVETTDITYVAPGEDFDPTSSLFLYGNGDGSTSTTTIDFASAPGAGFADEVENVSFRINDIDWGSANHLDIVTVNAYDAAGNPVDVSFTLGGGDTVSGNTITADTVGDTQSQVGGSVLIDIAGPVASIEILYDNGLNGTQGIWVSNINFDAVPDASLGGNDIIDGGAGDDLIFGELGDDTIDGGAGDDVIYGDEAPTPTGPNLITNGSFEDTTGMSATSWGYTSPSGVTGWYETNGGEIDYHNDGRGGIDPTDGSNWLDLAATTSQTSVSQDVAGLTDGADYELSFDVGDLSNGDDGTAADNIITVYWGGEVVAVIDPTDGVAMQSYTFTVTGGAGDGSDTLTFEGSGGSLAEGASLDNVQLYALTDSAGNDTITGGAGADTLYGGGGDDTIYFGAGDTVDGGDGDDTFILDPTNALGGAGSTITIVGSESGEGAGDTIDFNGLVDWGSISYDSTGEGGTVALTDGTQISFSNIENVIICFAHNTRLATPFGDRPIQDLRPGDFVLTRDNGPQVVRWIGKRTVLGTKSRAPIHFKRGAFGNERDLFVSPQHRMFYTGGDATLYFDTPEVMVPAKHLINGSTITQVDVPAITYYHVLFDNHEVVYANGAPSESFHPGAEGLVAIDPKAREELFDLFPELRADPNHYGDTARTVLKGFEAKLLNVDGTPLTA